MLQFFINITLTASTRNNDVFPAFCSPIIVMSISVALSKDASLEIDHIKGDAGLSRECYDRAGCHSGLPC